jgi:CelD/BcsL family acetyltransferase involved in cellulose biosynthesis
MLKTGYDPEYADYSPFNCLLFSTIELAYSEGFETIDLLGCDEPWKRVWTDQTIERRWLFLHRNTIRGLAIYYWKFVVLPRWKRWAPDPALTEKQPRPATPKKPKLAGAAS